MAWAHVATYNGTGNKSGGVAATATVTASVDDILIVCVACDGDAAAVIGTSAVTDSGSNSYTRIAHIAPNGNIEAAIFGTTVTNALSGGTVSFTVSTGDKDLTVYRFTGGTTTLRGSAATSSGSGDTISLANTNPNADDLVVGFGAMSGSASASVTFDSDTSNGSWSSGATDGTTGGSAPSNTALYSQYKIVTATATQTYDLTIDDRDWAAIVIALEPAAGGTNAPAQHVAPTPAINAPTPTVKPNAQHVAPDLAVNAPTPTVKAHAEHVTVTATANDTAFDYAPAEHVAPTVSVNSPTVTAKPNAEHVAPTLTVNDATVTTATTTEAPAEHVAPTLLVNASTATVKPNAEHVAPDLAVNAPTTTDNRTTAVEPAPRTGPPTRTAQ